MGDMNDVAALAIAELQEKSKKRIYQRDPEAWYADVLDGYWWSKQREVMWSVTSPDTPQSMVLVKSCNGIGKTRLAGDIATWYLSVFDPMELSILLTGPIFKQIKTGLFRYISDNYSLAAGHGILLPGRITEEPALKVARPGNISDKEVVQAKRPADNNLISSFQGIHDGIVVVLMDEAGGLPEDLYIGANAVTTNEVAKILAIGNPDSLHTPFHSRFTMPEKYPEWDRFTISAYDSPNLTGERIHPDPVKDKEIKSHLTQRKWVEMMERSAHPSVVRAKVYGEFPEDDTTSFFTQTAINTAYTTDIAPNPDDPKRLGVDLAFQGTDKSVAYLNQGGNIRKVDEWNFSDDVMAAAEHIHALALITGVDEVRVDASGQGRGVYSLLTTQEQFEDAPYSLIGVMGGEASPDNSKWAQARAWHYDMFRARMQRGLIDLDPDDTVLRDEMVRQPFSLNKKSAIQIMPKHEMRKAGITSPDELDAAIYSDIDFEWVMDEEQVKPGDRVIIDPYETEYAPVDTYGLIGGAF